MITFDGDTVDLTKEQRETLRHYWYHSYFTTREFLLIARKIVLLTGDEDYNNQVSVAIALDRCIGGDDSGDHEAGSGDIEYASTTERLANVKIFNKMASLGYPKPILYNIVTECDFITEYLNSGGGTKQDVNNQPLQSRSNRTITS